jgi:hypothetical protein
VYFFGAARSKFRKASFICASNTIISFEISVVFLYLNRPYPVVFCGIKLRNRVNGILSGRIFSIVKKFYKDRFIFCPLLLIVPALCVTRSTTIGDYCAVVLVHALLKSNIE